jgi:hypothetical protein
MSEIMDAIAWALELDFSGTSPLHLGRWPRTNARRNCIRKVCLPPVPRGIKAQGGKFGRITRHSFMKRRPLDAGRARKDLKLGLTMWMKALLNRANAEAKA